MTRKMNMFPKFYISDYISGCNLHGEQNCCQNFGIEISKNIDLHNFVWTCWHSLNLKRLKWVLQYSFKLLSPHTLSVIKINEFKIIIIYTPDTQLFKLKLQKQFVQLESEFFCSCNTNQNSPMIQFHKDEKGV